MQKLVHFLGAEPVFAIWEVKFINKIGGIKLKKRKREQIFTTKITLYNPYTPSQVWNITAPHNSY
jgi:hypothetical protein